MFVKFNSRKGHSTFNIEKVSGVAMVVAATHGRWMDRWLLFGLHCIVKRDNKSNPIVQSMVKAVKYVEIVRQIDVEIWSLWPTGITVAHYCSTSEIHVNNVKFQFGPLVHDLSKPPTLAAHHTTQYYIKHTTYYRDA
jgi:hypothetical protein